MDEREQEHEIKRTKSSEFKLVFSVPVHVLLCGCFSGVRWSWKSCGNSDFLMYS